MRKLFLFLFLISCSYPISNSDFNNKNKILDFDQNLTYNEFKTLLSEYIENSSYPNINK